MTPECVVEVGPILGARVPGICRCEAGLVCRHPHLQTDSAASFLLGITLESLLELHFGLGRFPVKHLAFACRLTVL